MGLQIAAAKTRASLGEPAKCHTVGESYSDVIIRVARAVGEDQRADLEPHDAKDGPLGALFCLLLLLLAN
jgi:hypothetical protein